MRKFSYLLTLLVVFACSEDFTTSPAVGALSDEALKNETGVNLLLTGAYSALSAEVNHGYGNGWGRAADNWTMDVMADDAHKGSTDDDQADLKEVELMNWSPANGYFMARWGVLFAGVNRANAVIALTEGIEGGDFSAQKAEAQFLRANFNFEIQRMWGNVPNIDTEAYQNSEFNQPNSGDIFAQIEADLQAAKAALPDTQNEPGRPTRWAAQAYLGKVYAQQGKYAEALNELRGVIDSNVYSLLPEYGDNFKAKGENGTESIFAIQFTTDSGQSFNANGVGALNFPNPGPFGSCCGFYQPTEDLFNSFRVDANGLPITNYQSLTPLATDYGVNSSEAFTPTNELLDPRVDFTIGRRGIDYNGYGAHIGKDWIRATFADISGPYLPKKNVYQASEAGATQATGGWGEQLSGLNYHIMRLGGIMLIAAEAAAETGDLGLATDYVNRIRNRAKSSTPVQALDGSGPAANYKVEPYPATFASRDAAIAAIRHEKRLETAMEGQRMFDLRRWDRQNPGYAKNTMNAYFDFEASIIANFGQKVNGYQDKHNVFPIPQQAIDLSGGTLQQNPGY